MDEGKLIKLVVGGGKSKIMNTLLSSLWHLGFLLDKKIGIGQPKRVEKARILIANTPMDTDKIKIFGSRVRVDSTAKVAELELAEKEKMKEKVEMILKHNINVFINRQLIYNYPEQLFSDAGVMAIEHADFDGIERLALVTGQYLDKCSCLNSYLTMFPLDYIRQLVT